MLWGREKSLSLAWNRIPTIQPVTFNYTEIMALPDVY
jgi:hypothetical protein